MHKAAESVIARDISPLPAVPQVQLLGHGIVKDHYGVVEKKLTHPSHTVFHKTQLTKEEMDAGYTRFYRWHMDAALYKLNPPKVTTLFGRKNPEPRREIVRYDDSTGDELEVQLGTTACKFLVYIIDEGVDHVSNADKLQSYRVNMHLKFYLKD